jgi:hypothetical protein
VVQVVLEVMIELGGDGVCGDGYFWGDDVADQYVADVIAGVVEGQRVEGIEFQ